MRYFAILHKSTGFYLPPALGAGGRGFTYQEPADPAIRAPRLFTSEGAAKTALTWWLKGITTVTHTAADWFNGEDGDEHWHTAPVADRRAEDMEVVALHLVR